MIRVRQNFRAWMATVIAGVLLVLSLPSGVSADPNAQINYQGKLTDSSGIAVTDGTYNMAFKLYTTSSGSTAVWSSTTTVAVTNGLFSYMLGSDDVLTGVNFNQTLYLGVNIGGTGAPSWDGEMTPRKVLGTVPAAFEAFQLGGVASTSFLRSDQADTASSLLTFTGGLISSASSTFAALTTVTATTTNLVINNELFTDLTGTGLERFGTTLRVASTSLGLGDGTLSGLSDVDTTNVLSGDLLSYNGSSWATTSTSTLNIALGDTTGTLGVTRGGTGLTSVAQGDLLYGSAADTISALNASSDGQVLWLTGGVPAWVSTSSLGINSSLFTDGGAITFLTDTTDELSIGASGLGGAKLSVQSEGTSDILNLFETGGSEVFTVLENGNVGIGSSTANTKLTIEDAEDTALLALGDSTNNDQVNLYTGTTSPEGRVAAPIGSLFLDSQNGALYQKTGDDDGNTSWGVFSVGTTTHMAQLVRATATSMPSITSPAQSMDFDTVTFDQGGLADVAADTITVKRAGKYLVQSFLRVPALDSGERIELLLYRNGSNIGFTKSYSTATNDEVTAEINTVIELDAGDVLTYRFTHNEGSAQTTLVAVGYRPRFTVTELGRVQSTGGNSLFTDGGADSYLTDEADNLLIGTSTNAAAAKFVIRQQSAADILNIFDGSSEVLTILDGGNVGIGTSSPASKLDVWGDFRVGTSGTPTLLVDTTREQVAIGTSSAWSASGIGLYLEDTTMAFRNSSALNHNFAIDIDSAGNGTLNFTNVLNIYDTGADVLAMSNNSGFLFNASGNASQDLRFYGDTLNDLFFIDAGTQRIGVATDTAPYTFTVAGDVMATGALYDNAYSAGTNGYVLQTTGSGFNWVATSSLGLSAVSALAGLSDVDVSGVNDGDILTYDGTNWVDVSTSTFLMEDELNTEAELEALLGDVSDVFTSNTDDISSAELITAVSDETGTGNLVFSADSTLTGTTTFDRASTSEFVLNQEVFTDLTGAGLTVTGNALTLDATGDWTGTIDGNNFADGAVETGDLLYGSAGGTISELNAGSDGQVLWLTGGVPAWVSTSSLGINSSLFTDSGLTTYLTSTNDQLTIGTTTASAIFTVSTTSASSALAVRQYGTGDLLNVFDAGTEVFTIEDGGFVGIGTDDPDYRLDVAGSGRFTRNDNNHFSQGVLTLYRERADNVDPNANFGAALTFVLEGDADDSEPAAGGISVFWENNQTNDTTDRDSTMSFYTMRDNAEQFDAMVLTSDGYLGIGTSSPGSLLSVAGDTYIGGDLRATGTIALDALATGGSSECLQVDSAGNVTSTGAGCAAAGLFTDAGLTTYLTSTNDQLTIGTTTASAVFTVSTTSATTALAVRQYGTGDLLNVFDAGTEVFTILDGGNVGIGTTSPASLLDVYGDFRVGTSSTPSLFVDVGENWVGVGTTSKSTTGNTSERLTIAGGGVVANHPSNPTQVGQVDDGDGALGLHVRGRYAYVADNGGGLEIIDVSDPTNPIEVGQFDDGGNAYNVFVAGRYAYLADGGDGLEIIDISDPSSPIQVGEVDDGGTAYDVKVVGQYAYVADSGDGLEIIDISDPTNPTEVGFHDDGGFAIDVDIQGRFAYVADDSGGIDVVDISDPTNPVEVGGIYDGGPAFGIDIVGRYAYQTAFNTGLEVFDMSDPTSPSEVGSLDTSGNANDVTVAGNYVYLADGSFGVLIIDISDPTNPRQIARFDDGGSAEDVFIVGRYAYVADNGDGLEILDIGGSEFNTLYAGVLGATQSNIEDNLVVGNTATIDGGLNVGNNAFVNGSFTVTGNASSSLSGVPVLFANESGVGIGTTSPQNPLHVVGNTRIDGMLNFEGSSASEVGLQHNGSGGLEVRAADDSGFATLIASSYYIGSYSRYLSNNGLVIDNAGGFEFNNTNASGSFRWDIDSDEKMRLDDTGFLGIGSTSPNTKLTVEDAEDTALLALSDSTNGNQANIYTGTTTPEGRVSAPVGSLFIDTVGGLLYQKTGDDWGNTSWGVFSVGTTTHMAQLVRATATSVPSNTQLQMDFDTVTIDQGGMADLGNYQITIQRSGKYLITANMTLGSLDNGEYIEIIVLKNGSTDVGRSRQFVSNAANQRTTAVVSQVIELVAGDTIALDVAHTEGAAQNSRTAEGERPTLTVTEVGRVQNTGGGSLFTDGGANSYLTDEADNLLIGTSTNAAAAKFVIRQQNAADILNIFDGSSEVLTILDGGNVGIGTTSPASKLDVWGDLSVNSLSAISNTNIGDASSWYFARASSTSVLSGAENNLAFGASSQALLTTGDQNIGLGYETLNRNTTGSQNIGIGESALYLSDGTTGNIGIGALAGDNITNGDFNVIIGYNIDAPSATADGQLNIGNLLFGTGLDGTGTTLSSGNISIGTTTSSARLSVQTTGTTDVLNLFETGGAEVFTVLENGNVGIGTTSPTALLTMDASSISGAGTTGIEQYFNFGNSVASAVQFGNKSFFDLTSNTATTTFVGNIHRVADGTTFGNTVRGLEVQTNRGANTQGENTALSGFARTFGVRGFSSGDAGGTFEPAGGFFETGGTTQGNAIRGYSSSITTASLLSLFQDSSDFTGTGLTMNFGNTTGSFSSTSSKYLDFQNAGTSVFTVSAFGTTTIGDGTTNNMAGLQIGYGGLCVDNDGTCNASTTGRITAVESLTGNSDLAEMYFSSTDLEPGEIVVLDGELSVDRATKDSTTPVIGVVSTKPGLLLGFDDTSLRSGETGYPIALSGRVPIMLSTENGPIEKGDPIMLSSLPGVGMKADGAGTIVGIALEDFNDRRMYSDTFVNQFGDDMVDPVYEPIRQVTDPRINDGCYYGGGGAVGETPCTPLSSTSTLGQIAEANDIIEAESVADAMAELAETRSETRTLADGQNVKVGQIVMFVDLREQWITSEQQALLLSFVSTSTLDAGAGNNDSLFGRLQTIAMNFVDGILTITGIKTDKVETKELCVDDVCVTADDLRTLLEAANNDDQVVEVVIEDETEEPAEDDTDTEAEGEEGETTDPTPTDTTPATSTEPTASSTDPTEPTETGSSTDPTEPVEEPTEPEPATEEPPVEPEPSAEPIVEEEETEPTELSEEEPETEPTETEPEPEPEASTDPEPEPPLTTPTPDVTE